ncbi:MAG: alpha-2-macroglobulin, partial [Pricia sp.]|nr:alpha-2-macroglobulin [Pricia sp.]
MLNNSGLTGNFSLHAHSSEIALNGDTHFSVEEYKRPKFETFFEPITETYKINDSITIKGTAKAYAGSNLSNAKVNYRVKRVVYYPKWYYWSRPYNTISPQEIAHGETTTNTLGEYEIDFKAIPDDDVSKKNLPTFQYEVTADVTDINGETQSATAFVTVGYHSLTATISLPDVLVKDKKNNSFTISTSNLNGQSVPAEGTVKMYKLKGPDYVLRPRPWPAPDYKNWTRPEFKKLFPHDAYEDEHDVLTWEKGELVWETTFDTGKSTKIEIESTEKWESGNYRIELETKDRFGQVVKALAQTTLISEDDRKLADNQLFHIKTDKESYSKGEKAEVTLLSSSKDLQVSIFVEKDKKIVDTRIIHLSENSKTVSIPVTEDDMGGFAINYTFSAYNSFHSGTLAISVPYPKTDLEIETMTFRDKLRPGTDETWSFRIKGPKGDKVSAELLASMYDVSLDAFRAHDWSFNPLNRNGYYSNFYTNVNNSFGISSFRTYLDIETYSYTPQKYDSFNWFGFYFGSGFLGDGRFHIMKKGEAAPMAMMASGMDLEESADQNGVLDSLPAAENRRSEEQYDQKASLDAVQIRQNLQETAFFFPQLMTDKDGNVSFSFTTPEALTQWKLQLLAHTKSLESAVATLETVTQKELMVLPNTPRFLREGDMVQFSAKVANLTDTVLSGQAQLELTDAITGDDISEQLLNSSQLGGNTSGNANQTGEASFMVDSLGNTKISWNLSIPENIQAVQYKIIARAGDFSDGEQNVLPVLTNRMLVTETMPMWVRSNRTKTFVLDKLKTNTSSTLNHHQLTLEVTSNPAWYAVQALPYLMEYPYDCNEQVFARYYANTLASHIANSNPRIREVFQQWESADVVVSNLEKNEELKSLLIQETPWLRDAQSETEQKKRIALLFNLDKMKHEQANSLNRLKNSQKSSGAWAWFNGGPDNRIITQHIITGLGHLNKLISPERITQNNTGSMVANGVDTEVQRIIEKAIAYL